MMTDRTKSDVVCLTHLFSKDDIAIGLITDDIGNSRFSCLSSPESEID
jgi:hypothetical protein